MSQDVPQDHISKKRAVYTIAGMENATIRKDVEYRTTDAGPLTMDVYYPADFQGGALLPAVVFVAGYNDVGYETMLGCQSEHRHVDRRSPADAAAVHRAGRTGAVSPPERFDRALRGAGAGA